MTKSVRIAAHWVWVVCALITGTFYSPKRLYNGNSDTPILTFFSYKMVGYLTPMV